MIVRGFESEIADRKVQEVQQLETCGKDNQSGLEISPFDENRK